MYNRTWNGRVGTVNYWITYINGWFIAYTDRASGVRLASSDMFVHPTVPRRRDAVVAIDRMARRYARDLQADADTEVAS